ncbi:MAG: hypothetical protein RL223_2603 [Pseudomonadota bacterium]
MKKHILTLAVASCFSLLSACGGGSSSDSSTSSSTSDADSGTTATTATTTAATTTTSSSRSSTATSAPSISRQPLSSVASVGASATLSVTAAGADTLVYQWYKDGSALSGATAATYTVASAASTDTGTYHVVVTNAKGTATSSKVTLNVTTATTATQTAQVTGAAQAFLATLSSTQQATAQTPYALDTARHWSNLPASMVSRNGVSWGSLSDAQKVAARALVIAALGSTGNQQHVDMQAAENYLYASGGGSSYGEGQYYIAVLGTPSTTGFWMLQITGHHLTHNLAFNGAVKSPTPLFMGVEPKAAFTYGGNTSDPMKVQREAMAALGSALTGYSGAKFSGTYTDLVFGANGSGSIDGSCPHAFSGVSEHGIAYASLSSTAQALVQSVIKAYVDTQASEYAADILAAYLSDSALAQTTVGYSGSGTVTASNNYFRIEGPRVWIEFSVQGGVIFNKDIHFHTIWRDKTGDYGGQCGAS